MGDWIIDNDYGLINEDFYIVKDSPQITLPCPSSYFRIENGVITNSLIPDLCQYSGRLNTQWYIDSNLGLTTNVLITSSLMGAFANAKKLSEVIIPKSCKKIGRYSFRNTSLREVVISRDCEYYPTSFPEGCRVKFYPD